MRKTDENIASMFHFLNDSEAFALGILSHLMKAAIEQFVDLWLVKGQFLHLSPVVQTEVHQMLRSSCKAQIHRMIFSCFSH